MRTLERGTAVVLFDGTCTLCCASVRFIAANDAAGRFTFASRQSARGRELVAASPGLEGDSIALLDYGRHFAMSDAVLHIALGLRAPWPLAFAVILVPRRWRDAAYRWIARNRTRWFGRTDRCAVAPAELREPILDGGA